MSTNRSVRHNNVKQSGEYINLYWEMCKCTTTLVHTESSGRIQELQPVWFGIQVSAPEGEHSSRSWRSLWLHIVSVIRTSSVSHRNWGFANMVVLVVSFHFSMGVSASPCWESAGVTVLNNPKQICVAADDVCSRVIGQKLVWSSGLLLWLIVPTFVLFNTNFKLDHFFPDGTEFSSQEFFWILEQCSIFHWNFYIYIGIYVTLIHSSLKKEHSHTQYSSRKTFSHGFQRNVLLPYMVN